tara:strand:- start:4279 stop:4602 length:324 start_codon:yes stop_codon:yes gene_type:complete
MTKRKKELKLTQKDIADVIKTIEIQFDTMDKDEKKAILKKLGISKNDIEKLDDTGLVNKVKSEYNKVLPNIDLNNFSLDRKYIIANEYISKKKKTELKKEIEDYKKL